MDNKKPFDAINASKFAWDFGIFDGCFQNAKAKPTDIDCMIEKNGYFLFIDFKSPNKNIPMGQLIAYKNLSKINKIFVLIVYGHTNQPEKIQAITNGFQGNVINCNLDQLRAVITHFDKFQQIKLPE